jgi:hypothetical protein
MRKPILLLALLFPWLFPSICYAGPFGLEAGMSRAEVVQRIGKSSIVKEYPDSIFFNSAPQRSEYFDEYQCGFDHNDKLASIHASSAPLATKESGEDLRGEFDDLKSALSDKYGKALYVVGSRTSGVKWEDSVGNYSPFMESVWDGSGDLEKSLHISKIDLKIIAWDKTHGFIGLDYQFKTSITDPL